MLSERNKRIAKFQKISGYLLWFSMPLLIITSLIGSLSLIFFVVRPIGDFSIIDLLLSSEAEIWGLLFTEKLQLSAKILCTVVGSIGLGIAVYILSHIQKLIECFVDGEIFNQIALIHARKAYKMNLYAIYLSVGIEAVIVAIALSLSSTGNVERCIHLLGSILSSLALIGFLSLLLWALEIGTELSDEAELTI